MQKCIMDCPRDAVREKRSDAEVKLEALLLQFVDIYVYQILVLIGINIILAWD